MGMFDGLLQQLETSPVVKKAMDEFQSVKTILIATVNRFDSRFGALDAKLDRVLFLMEHPSSIVPAGDDGLMKALASSGQEMIVRENFAPLQVVHETETQ